MSKLSLIRGIEVDLSRWVGAHNHITFEMQALSDEIETVTDLGGKCRIFHSVGSGGNLPAGHVAGADIVFHSPPEYNYVKGKITAISGSWFFDTDIDFVSINFSGGYVLSTTFMAVIATIFDARLNSPTFEAKYFPDGNGIVRADIAPFALDLLKLNQITDFSQSSQIDVGKDVFLRVTFALEIIREGVTLLGDNDIVPQNIFAVKGAKQLKDVNGENYLDH
ncbi:MAG: hypothetical protein ACC656_08575, partial [Candidatus Heimdallarchaeota archaeon]